MSRIYDVSVPIREAGLVYPGNPTITMEYQQALAKGNGANVSEIKFGSHTGTHVDAAKHFFDDGQTIDAVPLDRLIGPCLVIVMSDDVLSVGRAELERANIGAHKRVLIRTRNSAWLATGSAEFHPDFTYVAPDGAEYLAEKGVELVGVDYLSVEQFHSGHHMTHRVLLERAIVIIEGLLLSDVPPGEYQLICLPLKLEGRDGAPARAVLIG